MKKVAKGAKKYGRAIKAGIKSGRATSKRISGTATPKQKARGRAVVSGVKKVGKAIGAGIKSGYKTSKKLVRSPKLAAARKARATQAQRRAATVAAFTESEAAAYKKSKSNLVAKSRYVRPTIKKVDKKSRLA